MRYILVVVVGLALLVSLAYADTQPCATYNAALVSNVGYTVTISQSDGRSRTVWPSADVGAQWAAAWDWTQPHDFWRAPGPYAWSMTRPIVTLTSGHPFTVSVCAANATPYPVKPTPPPLVTDPTGVPLPAYPAPYPAPQLGAPPQLAAFVTAAWLSRTSARITWQGGNLYRVSGNVETLIGSGGGVVTLPPPAPSDAAYWPTVGDVYIVRDTSGGDVVAQTTLGARGVRYLPVLLHKRSPAG